MDVSCSFLDLVKGRAASTAARFAGFFVDGFKKYFVCLLMKFKLYHFSTGMALGLKVITPGKKIQGLLLGYVHFGCSTVWSKVSDGTTER